ncbi:cellulose biosynthesis protein BcsN [Rhizobium sullae]|uniref:Cellulose biosynthesis protein BcsN n=1 Tax=Rhizobium sullae TaxID=50338 RepID=A0A4R3QBI2_RHISU|nr:cellulose biosynthesis protein BcsN [Rhizobium sullae]TCU15406.1 cellulose biosynthesis protein BcsN [Rhizobium sullae]
MRLLGIISVAALAGTMAGCTSTSGSVRQPSAPEAVASEKALVLPPPGGPSIVSVVETRRGNGVEQTLSLFTSSSVPGQNFLKVQFLGASGSNPRTGNASYRMISESGTSREAFAAAPGVAMVRNTTFLQNSYGPFAYASGRSRGDTCLYGWQQIRSSQAAHTQGRNFGMIQVRLRLCDARASERQLLSVMYGYTITGTLDGEIWNPYGKVKGADEVLGRTGSPIYPDDGGYRAGAIEIGYEPAPPATRRLTRQAKVPAVARTPAPIGVRVPLPEPASEAPQANAQPAPSPVGQSAKAGGITVPSPDCVGDAAMTAACRR